MTPTTLHYTTLPLEGHMDICLAYVHMNLLGWFVMSENTDLYVQGLDSTLYRFLDADDRSKKEVVQAALEREYGGEKKHMAELRVERKERREELLEEELGDLEEELAEVREEKQRWIDHAETLDEEAEAYQDRLDALLADAEEGAILSADHPKVKDAATEYDMVVASFLDDLEERAEERGNYLKGGIQNER